MMARQKIVPFPGDKETGVVSMFVWSEEVSLENVRDNFVRLLCCFVWLTQGLIYLSDGNKPRHIYAIAFVLLGACGLADILTLALLPTTATHRLAEAIGPRCC